MASTPDDSLDVIVDQLTTEIRKKLPDAMPDELGSVIGDIRINTTINGASTLEVDVIDPNWVLITSGFLDIGDDQKFDAVDLNYPKGTNYWWRLTQAAPSTTSFDSPNLTLTFEARIVSYARGKTGAKSWSRAEFTRAQAIKAMTADEIKARPRPLFISPELDDRQPIAVSS